jgi:hypothetical protein
VALLGLVAVASRHPLAGGRSVGGGRGGGFTWLADLLTGWMALVAGFGLVVYAFAMRPAHRRGTFGGSKERMLMAAAVAAILLELQLRYHVLRFHQIRSPTSPHDAAPAPPPLTHLAHPASAGGHLPAFVLLALVLAGVVGGFALFAGRGPRRWGRSGPDDVEESDQRLAIAVAGAAWASLEDLAREAEPRRAVIAAYARMERGLRGAGVPRAAADTPTEYLTRAFARLPAGQDHAARLTALYVEARFSEHPVDEGMRTDAIAALQGLAQAIGARVPS